MHLLNGIIYWIDAEILVNGIIYWIDAGILVNGIISWIDAAILVNGIIYWTDAGILVKGIISWIDAEILVNAIIYWIDIGILVHAIIYWNTWNLVLKWIGYPFVNVVFQIKVVKVNHHLMVIGWNILRLSFWFDLEITVTYCRTYSYLRRSWWTHIHKQIWHISLLFCLKSTSWIFSKFLNLISQNTLLVITSTCLIRCPVKNL